MSPRCPSRDSRESSGPASGSPPPAATRSSSSPVSPPSSILPAALPLGVHPLLPPQSAAMMAAYLQQTHQRLLLGHSPLSRSSASPLVSSSCSPPAATPGLHVSPIAGDVSPGVATQLPAVLDFSTRKAPSPVEDDDEDEQILNLSKPPTPSFSEANNGPLDLSVPNRKRPVPEDSPPPPPRKSSRLAPSTPVPAHQDGAYARQVASPWTSPVVASHFPYFAAAVAAAATSQQQQQQHSPKSTAASVVDAHQLWNGKIKPSAMDKPYQPSEATKALEKMSELSKLGGDDLFRATGSSASSAGSASATTSSRHSAWQSHWLNKGADQAKDVLKCVWCKQSFPTLAAMTTHMKEAKHCGVNMPVPPPGASTAGMPTPTSMPPSAPQQQSSAAANNSSSSNSKQSPSEINLLIKETMPLPRKLVRGQDVWLGKGAEQTRQILKCMWCGQSFRSLAEMTSHMQQTQPYTNIISQEQIISWKSSDENKGGGGGAGGGSGSNSRGGDGSAGGASSGGGSGSHGGSGPGAGATSSHVSAVLTCKVCDQAFSSLKELSNHMVKNSHYKEHIMRSITESGGRRRQTREKRKKSLPVRKLLELERAQNEFKNGDASAAALAHGLGKHAGRITCEKCGDKIETSIFVEHIRQCIGAGVLGANQRNFLKNALMSNSLPVNFSPSESGRKSVNEDTSSVSSRHHRSPSSASDATTPGKETPTPAASESGGGGGGTSSPSVLNAIEKLIEKSFDSRIRHGAAGMHHAQPGAPIGSSILKRLGIDESVDYTKPLVDPQTMNLLRSYHQQHFNAASVARRERSGSESSSISERGSGRTDTMTPERRLDLSASAHDRLSGSSVHSQHQRSTPDKQVTPLPARHPLTTEESEEEDSIVVKKEPKEEDAETSGNNDTDRPSESLREVAVKKEASEDAREEDESDSFSRRRSSSSAREASEERKDVMSPQMNPPTPRPLSQAEQIARSPCRNSTSSPTSSDRSVTPRGTPDNKASSSLGALSSMFDSLSGGGGNSASTADNQGRKTSSHPLAALQKLCDKTETRGSGGGSRAGSASGAVLGPGSSGSGSGGSASTAGPTPGAILAFSWACNDAVMTADSIMKCAFCDTPFISKGAYRHHLSKMHFVKDGVIPDAMALGRSSAAASASGGPTPGGSSHSSSSPPASQRNKSPPMPQANGSPSQPASSPLEESPHSKFLKYTELAKQLSSKYV